MKLKVAALMAKAGMTAYALSRDSNGRIPQRTAYRLSKGEKAALYPEEIAALCDIFKVTPGELFDFKAGKG